MPSNLDPSRYPHCAVPLSVIDPSFAAGAHDERRLQELSALLPVIGAGGGRPGFCSEFAIDSIGRTLDPRDPEPYRRALVAPAPGAHSGRCVLFRPQARLLSPEEADELEETERGACIPVLGSSDVALRIPERERAPGVVRVEFDAGGSVELRAKEGRLRMDCAAVDGVKTVIECAVPAANAAAVDALFTPFEAEAGEADATPDEAWLALDRVVARGERKEWTMPLWLSELAVGRVWQDLLRAHVLVSAAVGEGASRPLQCDETTLRRAEPKEGAPYFMLVSKVHASCTTCICPAHQRAEVGGRGRVELCIRACGSALDEAGRCSVHYRADAAASRAFPDVCACGLQAWVACCHSAAPPYRVNVSLKHAARGAEAALACAVSVARSDEDATRKRAAAERECEQACVDLASGGFPPDALFANDIVACALLRSGGAENGPLREGRATLKAANGGRLGKKEKDVERTHASLFRPYKRQGT